MARHFGNALRRPRRREIPGDGFDVVVHPRAAFLRLRCDGGKSAAVNFQVDEIVFPVQAASEVQTGVDDLLAGIHECRERRKIRVVPALDGRIEVDLRYRLGLEPPPESKPIGKNVHTDARCITAYPRCTNKCVMPFLGVLQSWRGHFLWWGSLGISRLAVACQLGGGGSLRGNRLCNT